MPVPAGFAQALVDYAEAIGDVKPLEEERDALFLSIRAGEAGALISSTINGKQFGFTGGMTVEEKFQAFVEAIKTFNGARITTTYAGFSRLQR